MFATNATQDRTIMETKLRKAQETELCRLIGNVQLSLLYKASYHGKQAAAFHQKCDRKGPTLTVGYSKGHIFGGYTSKDFDQTGQYVHDDKAFLFSFKRGQIVKYPVQDGSSALVQNGHDGPSFGKSLVFLPSGQLSIQSNSGYSYNFDAAEMHGNHLQLTECEVFQVEEGRTLEKPWRNIIWEAERKKELIESIKQYKPIISSVSQIKVLLIGPIGAGKSSFFNSINSIFRGHVTNQALSGSSSTSLTTRFRTYSVKAGREGKPLPIILCDTMGLEEATGAGIDVDDVISILKGHMPNRHQFHPSVPLQTVDKSAQLQDQIHCVAYVIDGCKVSIMSAKMEAKLSAIRWKINRLGIPQLVLMTKVDEACPDVADDLRNIYVSQYIRTKAQEVSVRLGVPLSCVLPVKNYSEELELDLSTDILLLTALVQMLRSTDSYFDDISELDVHD
ncbi:interferon-induced protein 44-like [Osmerus mordax]|uniref:interferon-induced protein 44-like n=1 Tax=Osmerus mordax TaxID=8014 RepID=UPI0035103BE7